MDVECDGGGFVDASGEKLLDLGGEGCGDVRVFGLEVE